jgi:transposase-like protein
VRRKAAVVAAVRSGELTLEQACRRYQLSEEELRSWERAFDIYGLHGLRTTRTQQYRRPSGQAQARAAARKQPTKRQPQPGAVL